MGHMNWRGLVYAAAVAMITASASGGRVDAQAQDTAKGASLIADARKAISDMGIEIRDAEELRLKESDRLLATAENLRAMGANVEEFDDGIAVSGPTELHGATIDSFGDHRIAMAFSVAALIASGQTEIMDSECVGISFPEFFSLLETLAER